MCVRDVFRTFVLNEPLLSTPVPLDFKTTGIKTASEETFP